MKYLEDHRVIPGSMATVAEVLPFNKTIELTINDVSVILGLDVASNIFVEPVNE
jgi:Fe2+ transport system protein FeoA